MQRGEALRYMRPARLTPLHHRPAWGNDAKQELFSQVNRGPMNLGRSPSIPATLGLQLLALV
jgi:hypothetical protein